MKKILIFAVIIICLLTIAPLTVVDAQTTDDDAAVTDSDEPADSDEPEEQDSESSEEMAEDVMSIVNEPPPVLDVDEGGYISTSSFAADHYMVGLFSEITEGFNTGNWDITDAQLTLSFSTTQLVSEVLSDITISVNGVRFYSERVPVTDGNRRELTVKIPIEHIAEGYNVLAIEGYIRTYDGLPCVDDVTTANWMNVFADSFIELSYHPMQPCTNIDDFYSCFTSIDALENNQSAVVVPTGYDTDELDAALTALSGVSKQSTLYYQNIALIASDRMADIADKKYVIYVAKTGSLPPDVMTAVSENGSIQGADEGMFMIPGSTNMLVVTADSGAVLDKAAAVLSDATTMNQLKGRVKIISEDEDVFVRKEGVTQYTALTETGTYLDGAFRQKADYFIDFDNNRKLAYGSELELYYRYSENLDFDRSLVSVYVNNVPIGSQKLSEAKAEGDYIELNIPTDIEITGSFTLTVAFDLEIKDLWCTLRQSETPWAYISSESMLKLNSVEVPYYLFENYPYPFVSGGEFNDVVLIVPDENNDLDLDLMGDFMLTMGQFIKYNTGTFSVARASDTGDLQGKNVIAIGTNLNNPFISELNDKLYFKFYSNGAGIMSNEKLLIEPSYSTTLATAQLIQSPYSNVKNAILVLASAQKNDLGNAMKYFGDTTELWKLTGDGFVADEDDIYLYRFKEESAKEHEATQDLFERTDIMNLLYVAGAVFILLLAAVMFMIIKYRRNRNHEEK
jgi:hypothetical protein